MKFFEFRQDFSSSNFIGEGSFSFGVCNIGKAYKSEIKSKISTHSHKLTLIEMRKNQQVLSHLRAYHRFIKLKGGKRYEK